MAPWHGYDDLSARELRARYVRQIGLERRLCLNIDGLAAPPPKWAPRDEDAMETVLRKVYVWVDVGSDLWSGKHRARNLSLNGRRQQQKLHFTRKARGKPVLMKFRRPARLLKVLDRPECDGARLYTFINDPPVTAAGVLPKSVTLEHSQLTDDDGDAAHEFFVVQGRHLVPLKLDFHKRLATPEFSAVLTPPGSPTKAQAQPLRKREILQDVQEADEDEDWMSKHSTPEAKHCDVPLDSEMPILSSAMNPRAGREWGHLSLNTSATTLSKLLQMSTTRLPSVGKGMARSDSADALCGSPRSSSEAICASPRSGVDHSGSMDVRQYQRLLDRVAPDEEVGQESIGVMVGIGMALCALGPLMIAVLAVSVLTTLDSSILAALLTVLTARFARSFINASLPGSCFIHRLLDHPWRGEMRQVLCVLLLLAPVIAVLELSKGPYPPTPGSHVAQGAASWGWAGSGGNRAEVVVGCMLLAEKACLMLGVVAFVAALRAADRWHAAKLHCDNWLD